MPESGNGHVSWLSVFLKMRWQSQVAVILSVPALVGGGGTVINQFLRPDPVVAEIGAVLEAHRNESRAINATLITELDSLNTSAGKISNAMFYNICQESADQDWLVRLGRRGQSYCESITNSIEREFARGAYR